ncbi:MAG: hypothetical protein GWM98_00260, partial [Nitrospinaceae bacterium]|nr:hypothetical protein [Nitrospinaceae bacterium]NIS83635.1 hypothetical protein [Nitrospinaceae bacterium]NIT80425.1 hypothetical protein [Nitrospinaceae bacterium]NIU94826.1 hypothetical protein [Nitrospinaceae bacterium]NIY13419.1 hypothetical protein [Nitrospinaceae bacterium]
MSGFLAGAAVAEAPGHTFNRLVQEKASLETRFGVATLECFPFVEHIGRTEDQVPLIERCLRGTRTLGEALEQVPDAGIRMVGVSDRFLR